MDLLDLPGLELELESRWVASCNLSTSAHHTVLCRCSSAPTAEAPERAFSAVAFHCSGCARSTNASRRLAQSAEAASALAVSRFIALPIFHPARSAPGSNQAVHGDEAIDGGRLLPRRQQCTATLIRQVHGAGSARS